MTATPDFPSVSIGPHTFVLTDRGDRWLYEEPDIVIEWCKSPGTGEWIGSYYIDGEYLSVRHSDEATAWDLFSNMIFGVELPTRYRDEE